jgi:hypothetical protein
MPESLQETLRSDGTSFQVVSDADISNGALLDALGNPRFPMLISLASEALRDDEIAPLTNYVAAGGFLLVGSSSFTRQTDGTSRGDFAIAGPMGIHSSAASLQNWALDNNFTKQQNHRIITHIPGGQITWRMPISADEINWGISPAHPNQNPHLVWQVRVSDATVLAQGDTSPYLVTKHYGKGQFIYISAMQPFVGHGSWAPGMYAYAILRKSIEWAFDSAQLPIPKVSPWPYQYDAAFIIRHDLEDYRAEISNVAPSAKFENDHGAAGDYYFCTGTLRSELGNDPNVIAGLSNAVVLYHATIGSHNGGLANPNNPSLHISDFDYWHWGPDEALGANVSALGYADGKSYALASLLASFNDIEGWLAQTPNFGRAWVGCYFNSTREDSYDVLNQLGVKTVGEQKLGPFPHWTVSTRTSSKRYPMLTLPVSDWFVGTQIGQSMEEGHTTNSIHNLVDFYYNMGGLINLYGHTLSIPGISPGTAGTLPQEYITYSLNSSLHPRVWSANAASMYDWGLKRSGVQIVPGFSSSGNQSVVTMSISGASDPSTSVELMLPGSYAFSGLTVLANGAPADPSIYRLNGQNLKVQVGTTVTSLEIDYTLGPYAQNDLYSVASGANLSVAAPGLLTNDSDPGGLAGDVASVVNGPGNGVLVLTNNGGFSYVPNPGFSGIDAFTYQITDPQSVSSTATSTICVLPPGSLFYDNFARPTDPGFLLPWTVEIGTWITTAGLLQGGLNPSGSYGFAFVSNNWANYSVEGRIRFPAGAFAGGIGARLNPQTGAHYGAWIYPETAPGGNASLSLIKFQGWTTWGYNGSAFTPIQRITLPGPVGTDWHNLKLAVCGNRLAIYLDGVQMISAADAEAQPYLAGGISADMYTDVTPYAMSVDDVLVKPLALDDSYVVNGNSTLTVTAPGVLANDTPVSGTTLTASPLTMPVHGTLAMTGDGGFVYTPANGFGGPDSFTYQAHDAAQVVGNATVTINVINARPVLVVTPDDQVKVYGANNPALTGNLAGLQPGDNITASYTTTATANSPVGTYNIVATLLDPNGQLANYSSVVINTGTLTINPATLVITATASDKTYDGTPSASVTLADNRLTGDLLTIGYSSASFDSKDAAPGKLVTVGGITVSGQASENYTYNTSATTSANITPLPILGGITALNKVYDANRTASIASRTLTGVLGTDDVSYVGGTAVFSDKNVGAGKTVSATGLGLTGANAADYSVNSTATTTANITARPLTVTAQGNDKVYDGTTTATVSLSDNRVSGDTLVDGYGGASFADKNVGNAKPVTVTGVSITGADAGNYAANTSANASANILVRQITVTAVSDTKVYDGTTSSTGVPLITGGLGTGDSGVFSQTFGNKSAATGKTLVPGGAVTDGNSGNNYNVTFVNNASGVITPLGITGSITASDKVYDGTTAATISTHMLSGVLGSDNVSCVGGVATFADKNVGVGKTVTATGLSLSGGDAVNYSVNDTATTTANVTTRALTIAAQGNDKVYDGTTTATVSLSDNRVAGDTLVDGYSGASFADKNVGNAKPVTVTGVSITGADAGNYAPNMSANASANILARQITVTAVSDAKVYDGTSSSVGVPIIAGGLGSGDSGVFNQTFGNKGAGIGKTLVPGGAVTDANGGNNYNMTFVNNANGVITPLAITGSITSANKVYDGTTAAAITARSLSGVLGSDNVSYAGGLATFADKNVGVGKTVTASGLSLSGGDASNYSVNGSATTTASITALPLNVTATGVNKTYDATATATVTLSDNRVTGDVLNDAYTSASFASKTVGTSKTVNVTGISIGGVDALNYALQNTTATTVANIAARLLTVTAAGINKGYDGTTAASVTLSDNRVAGDLLTDSYGTASFTDRNVGTGKLVNVIGISVSGSDFPNYSLQNTTATTTANITSLVLTITATGINKVYDAKTNAMVTLSDNRLAGDQVTDNYGSAGFANKNVGTNKSISVTGISISGADAPNYSLHNTTAATTANITRRPLTVVVTNASNKVYDGKTAATVALDDNMMPGDTVYDFPGTGNFADKNVGTNKTVTVTGIYISGPDANNYQLQNTVATNYANITVRSLKVTASGQNKVYDAKTNATVTLSDNKVSGDSVTDSYTNAFFASKVIGTNKTVSVQGISLGGTDAPNYALQSTTASTTANITSRPLTVVATGVNKTYDGTTVGTVTLADNKMTGDVVNDSYVSANFSDKNVGVGKAMNVTGVSIYGADASNYALQSTSAGASANITARQLTVTATAVNKTYDGTTAATATLSDNRVTGDNLSDNYTSASFADKNVGAGKTVSVAGVSISGIDAPNYALQNTTAGSTAAVTARSLTVAAAGVNKTYDGTTTATVTLSDNRVAGDALSDSYSSAAFVDKSVGTGKPVSVTGISVTGSDTGNYALQNTSAATSANITGKALVVSAQGTDKVYDGATGAIVTLSDNRVVGDVFNDNYSSAAFSDRNVGTAKGVSVAGISLSGTDAGNYMANTTANTTANITTRPITVTAVADSKTYDGGNSSLGVPGITGALGSGDTGAFAQSFDNRSVGSGKTVSPSGTVNDGNGGENYTITFANNGNGVITTLGISGSISAASKVYDGTTAASITARTLTGVLGADVVSYVGGTASFADKNVGVGKTVTATGLSLGGLDALNYAVNTTAATTADITGKALVVSAQGVDKVYDGTTGVTVALSDDRVAGDVFNDNYSSASFVDRNAGGSKAVSVSGISLSGADAGNYMANTTANTTANITARPITVTAVGDTKTYDGNNGSAVVPAITGGLGFGDTAAFTQSFDNKGAGSGKTLSPGGAINDGNGGNNYTISFVNNGNGVITQLGIAGNITAASKVYDGTTAASITARTLTGVLGADVVSYVGGTGNFADKNVGTGKTVTAIGLSLSGTDAANYAVNATAMTTADITPATLVVQADNKSRIYDTPNPTLTASFSGCVDPSTTSAINGNPGLSTTATTLSPVGAYPILVTLGTLSAPNYTFTLMSGSLTVVPPPNTPPVLPAQTDRNLIDLTTLVVNNAGTDSDIPGQQLSYQLVNQPAGMQIDNIGSITWTPTLAQSPSTNVITTIVTDNGIPALSATNSFTVIVTGPYDGINLTDPVQAMADPDGDRLSNLIEYGLGTDPRNPGDAQSALVSSVVSDAGGQYVALQYRRRTQNGGISIQYIPEVSGDQQTWFSDSAHVLEVRVTPLDPRFEQVLVRDRTITSVAVPRYIRLRVVEN